AKQYRGTFGDDPPARLMQALTSPAERRDDYERAKQIARERGYKPTWAMGVYRRTYGEWPRGR
ncbi:MAG: hypothetical protein WC999_16135, partial [Hydrogenophaga sp.]